MGIKHIRQVVDTLKKSPVPLSRRKLRDNYNIDHRTIEEVIDFLKHDNKYSIIEMKDKGVRKFKIRV